MHQMHKCTEISKNPGFPEGYKLRLTPVDISCSIVTSNHRMAMRWCYEVSRGTLLSYKNDSIYPNVLLSPYSTS
jgi:hypothetical protein